MEYRISEGLDRFNESVTSLVFVSEYLKLDRIGREGIKWNLSSFWPVLQIELGLDLCLLEFGESNSLEYIYFALGSTSVLVKG